MTIDKQATTQQGHAPVVTVRSAAVPLGNDPGMVRFTHVVAPLGGKNLLPNGSFEAGTAGWSSLGLGVGHKNSWAPLVEGWGNLEALHGTVELGDASHGKHFLRTRLGGGHTPVLDFDYFVPVHRRELRPLAASVGWIEVTPGQPYTISVDMRASHEGIEAAFGVLNEDAAKGWTDAGEEILKSVTLTKRWQRYTHTFTPKYPFVFVLAGPCVSHEQDLAVDLDAIQLEKGGQATAFAPRDELEIGIVPQAPGGVFTLGGPARLQITAANASAIPRQAQVSFRVIDFFDQSVELPDAVFAVPAHGQTELLVTLPDAWRGFYRVVAQWDSGATIESHLLRLAIVPPSTGAETVIGVNHAYPTASLISLAAKAGVSWSRDWSLKWQHIEPQQGQYQWEVSDAQLSRVANQGLHQMAMISFPSTDWNSSAPDLATLQAVSPRYRAGGTGDEQELLVRARWAWPPRVADDLNRFISTAVHRYQGQVQVWEFLNEPLYTTYSLPDFAGCVDKEATLKSHSVGDYLSLLRTAASAIRAANPQARIMGGPAMHPAGQYVQPMLEAGILDLVDIFGLHDYPGRDRPETRIADMDKLLAAMIRHGGPKPLWMTEFSYFGSDDLPRAPFVPIPGLWSEVRLLSEQQVADYTIRYCTIFLGRGGEKVFLHSGCTGSVNKPGTESCLFADGAVRKVFPALAVFTALMGPHPRFVADRAEGGAYVFAFETDSRSLLLAWAPDGRARVGIPAGVDCQDLMGRPVAGAQVELIGSPLYLSGPPGQAAKLVQALILRAGPAVGTIIAAAFPSPTAAALASGATTAMTIAAITPFIAAVGLLLASGTLSLALSVEPGGDAKPAPATAGASSSQAPVFLVPGQGFAGPTPEPAVQGVPGSPGIAAKAIARWEVVPFQTIAGEMAVGVVAFHINGIARVEFSVDGGPWAHATAMTRNPHTGVWEYWAMLKASDCADGKRELRAIAYPVTGVPRVLQDASGQDLGDKSLHLYTNAKGTLPNSNVFVSPQGDDSGDGTRDKPFPTLLKAITWLNTTAGGCAGANINLLPGSYAYPDVPGDGAPDRWLTIRAAPGVAKADVVLTPALAGITQRKVKVTGLTMRQTTDAPILSLRSSPYGNHFWVDDCELIGRGYIGETISTAGFVSLDNGALFFTDCLLHDTQAIPFSQTTLVRRCRTYNLGSDLIRSCTLIVDVAHQHTRINPGVHPDVVQYPIGPIENFIIYGLKATDVVAQGFAIGDVDHPQRNVALVNILMQQAADDPQHSWLPAGSSVDHVLWWHVTFATHDIQTNTDGQKNYSLRNCAIQALGSTAGRNVAGWSVDNNHFAAGAAFGIRTTSGAPGFADAAKGDFRPGDASPLRDRGEALLVPVDVDGHERSLPTAIGAYAWPGEYDGRRARPEDRRVRE